jgi:CBS domain-containing protein
MIVKEIMNNDVFVCRPEASLAEAAVLMWEKDCGALPVVNEARQVVGMITDRDIAIAVATRGRPASAIPVGEVTTGMVYACLPLDEVSAALEKMREKQVRRLPVIDDNGTLIGMLSISDVLLHTSDAAGRKRDGLSPEETLGALKAICEHYVPTSAATQTEAPKTARA